MNKKKNYNPFQGTGYAQFNALSQQLERQNAMLMKERSKLLSGGERYQSFPSQNTITEKEESSIEEDSVQNVQLPHFEVSDRKQNGSQRKEKKSVREEIVQRGELVSDDVMEMIEEIQRKALAEIQSLRADKISLLKRLNSEIKSLNAQKKKSSRFEKKVANLNQSVQKIKSQQKRPQQERKESQNIIYEEEQQNSPSPQPSYLRSDRKQNQQQYDSDQQAVQSQRQGQSQHPQAQQRRPAYTNEQRNTQQSEQIYQNFQPIEVQVPQQAQSTRRPPNPINENVIPAQSFYYTDKPPKINTSGSISAQAQIQNEINRLRQENASMRNTLSRNNVGSTPVANFAGSIGAGNKNLLRNQLAQLENKAARYREMIQRNKHPSEGFEGSEIQTLFLQGANLAQQGQRLMKVKSNPQLRSTIGAPRAQNPEAFYPRSNFTGVQMGSKANIEYENERSIQTPMDNSRRMRATNSRFSPGEYENILANMRRAVNS